MKGNITPTLLFALLSLAAAQDCGDPDRKYYPDAQQCDGYVECVEGSPQNRLCPDGLLFNDLLTTSGYPCAYPPDVECGSRTQQQPAQRSGNCPRLWGMFRAGVSDDECGQFYNCVDGREFLFNCPEGLAWNRNTYRCDWPDEVDDCNVDAYLGFSCPAERDALQEEMFGHERYAYPGDCKKFYLCIAKEDGSSRARLGSCGFGTVYNQDSRSCDDQENVPGCETTWPVEEVARARDRQLRYEERRERRLQELQAAGTPGLQ